MKRFIISNKELISFYLLVLFLLTAPLKNNFNSMALILLGVFAVMLVALTKKFNVSLFKKFIPLLIFYLLALISILYSEDKKYAADLAMRLLPFALFPFIFSVIGIKDQDFKKLTKVFIFWMVALCIYSHISVLIKLFNNNDILYNIFNSHYSYLSLSQETIGLHSTYYAYYIIIAVMLLTQLLFKEKKRGVRLIYILVMAYFTFFIFHLSARLPVVVLFLFYNAAIINYFLQRKQIGRGIAFLVALYLVSGIFVYNVRITRYRFQQLTEFTYSDGTHYEDVKNKFLQWQSGIEANKNLLFGNGIGDASQSIFDSYIENGLDDYAAKEYNAHNQFIQTYAGMGMLGVAALLFIFIFYFREFYINASFLGYSLMILTFILFQTESYLERHSGIVMFVFLICFMMKKQETTSIQ